MIKYSKEWKHSHHHRHYHHHHHQRRRRHHHHHQAFHHHDSPRRCRRAAGTGRGCAAAWSALVGRGAGGEPSRPPSQRFLRPLGSTPTVIAATVIIVITSTTERGVRVLAPTVIVVVVIIVITYTDGCGLVPVSFRGLVSPVVGGGRAEPPVRTA